MMKKQLYWTDLINWHLYCVYCAIHQIQEKKNCLHIVESINQKLCNILNASTIENEKPKIIITSLKSFNNAFWERFPHIESAMIDFASDLELPGFPTRKRGILSSMHTAIMNIFSRRAAFLAIFIPIFMLSSSTSWQLHIQIIMLLYQ